MLFREPRNAAPLPRLSPIAEAPILPITDALVSQSSANPSLDSPTGVHYSIRYENINQRFVSGLSRTARAGRIWLSVTWGIHFGFLKGNWYDSEQEAKMNTLIMDRVIEQLEVLPYELQWRVLEFTRALAASVPHGVTGQKLLRFAGVISLDDLQLMRLAIEQGCERVDTNEW